MLAYACEPGEGGEPSVGWHWAVNATLNGHRVTVVTRSNNAHKISTGLEDLPDDVSSRLEFVYRDLGPRFLRLKRRGGIFGLLGYYYVWQISLLFFLRGLARREKFDLAHHVTFCNDSIFSALVFSGLPLVIGPTGGYSHKVPRQILRTMDGPSRQYERRRRALQFCLRYCDPLSWLSRIKAHRVLPYTEETTTVYSRRLRTKSTVLRHVGLGSNELRDEPKAPRDKDAPLLLVSAGRLVHWKGFDIAIDAAAAALRQGVPLRLVIIGKGPDESKLRRRAQQAGVEAQVEFLGRLDSHDDVLKWIGDADVYIQPTLRDGPPVAILEALARGTLVMTADAGANAEVLGSRGGVLARADAGRERLVTELAAALVHAHADPDWAATLAAGGLQVLREERTWDVIGREVERFYQTLNVGP